MRNYVYPVLAVSLWAILWAGRHREKTWAKVVLFGAVAATIAMAIVMIYYDAIR